MGPGKHSGGHGYYRRALQKLREECRYGEGSAVFAAQEVREKVRTEDYVISDLWE